MSRVKPLMNNICALCFKGAPLEGCKRSGHACVLARRTPSDRAHRVVVRGAAGALLVSGNACV
jgi:hypothetical protein